MIASKSNADSETHLGVKILLLNNEEQGMVTQVRVPYSIQISQYADVVKWQSLFYEDRFAHTHQKNPDFVKLSEAMGVQAQRCVAPGDVENKLKWLIESDGPALLEVVTDKKVPVLPMVPGGKALHEFLVYDEGS